MELETWSRTPPGGSAPSSGRVHTNASLYRSRKEECLSQILPLGEQHIRRAVTDYTELYHGEENHQCLGNKLIERPTLKIRGRDTHHNSLRSSRI